MIIQPEELQKLSPRQKGKVIESVILSLVQSHGDRGLTAAEIEKMTGLNRRIIKMHLDKLVAMRELYYEKVGNTYLYFPNGRIERKYGTKYIEVSDDLRYAVSVLRSNKGAYGLSLYIQEQRRDPTSDVFRTQGGIIVPMGAVPQLLTGLHEFFVKIAEMSRSEGGGKDGE